MAAHVLLALLCDVAKFRFTRLSGMHGRSVVGKQLEGYPYRKHALGIRSVGAAPFLLGVFAVFAVCDLSLAEDGKSCEQRRDEIAHEREQAIRYGNIYQQRGLEAALSRVQRYCRDDEPSQNQEQLSRALKDVHRREDQLEAVIESGSARMIERYKRKLEQARERLRSVSGKEK
jgi:hypothetical protein